MKVAKFLLRFVLYLIGSVMFVSILYLRWSGYGMTMTLMPTHILLPIFVSLCISILAIEEIEAEEARRRRRNRKRRH